MAQQVVHVLGMQSAIVVSEGQQFTLRRAQRVIVRARQTGFRLHQ